MTKIRLHFSGKVYKRSLSQKIELMGCNEFIGFTTKKKSVIYETTTIILGGKMMPIQRELGSLPKNRWDVVYHEN